MKFAHAVRVFAAFGAVILNSQANAQLSAGEKFDIGFTSLQTRLGIGMPTGSGISVSQVEALEGGVNYRPESAIFPDKAFQFPSGGSTTASGHATTVGRYFYGPDSLAPEIGRAVDSKVVTSYEVGHFLNNALNVGSASQLPAVEANDVQNHSWIGTTDNAATDQQVLRRMDFQIQRDDFVAVFGLNNGSGTPVPNLMAGAYNGITVGLSNGNHSSGATMIEGARTRPDLVVPTSATSWAAPTVSGAAALVIETARETPGLGNGDRSFVVKSILMTGATRDEPEFTAAWTNSSTQPLDATYGAGELNIDRSHAILTAGEFAASSTATVGSTGWDAGLSSAAALGLYFFDLSTQDMIYDVAGTLVWNRAITAVDTQAGPGVNYTFNSTLQNLDLRLFRVSSGFTPGEQLAASVSTVDNVELITFENLASGRYVWSVSADTTGTEYGFSWVAGSQVVPEPSVAALLLALPLVWLRRRR